MRNPFRITMTQFFCRVFVVNMLMLISGMLLMASYISHAVYPAPGWFAVDGAERVYLSYADGVHVFDAQTEIAHYQMKDASARLYVRDGVLTIVNGAKVDSFVLTGNALCPLQTPLPDSDVQEQMQSRTRKYCVQGANAYRYEARFLRWRIVREADGAVLQQMPVKDWLCRCGCVLLGLVFVGTIAFGILLSYRFWTRVRRSSDPPKSLRDYYRWQTKVLSEEWNRKG